MADTDSGGSEYPSDQLRDDLAALLHEQLGDDSTAYLHSSDLAEHLDANARRIGRNLEAAAERAGLHAEKWSHNGRSTTWLVEDRGDREGDGVDRGDSVETDGGSSVIEAGGLARFETPHTFYQDEDGVDVSLFVDQVNAGVVAFFAQFEEGNAVEMSLLANLSARDCRELANILTRAADAAEVQEAVDR
ncbi:hypothetical protein [Haloplanus salinarum]|uniref:hypothetical protein n=1 Tax=Haloplanus salinarum TaxID=1912324 RepID=UPI00214D0D31|nr:hypothetical protein [Haloplanus salinarum]